MPLEVYATQFSGDFATTFSDSLPDDSVFMDPSDIKVTLFTHETICFSFGKGLDEQLKSMERIPKKFTVYVSECPYDFLTKVGVKKLFDKESKDIPTSLSKVLFDSTLFIGLHDLKRLWTESGRDIERISNGLSAIVKTSTGSEVVLTSENISEYLRFFIAEKNFDYTRYSKSLGEKNYSEALKVVEDSGIETIPLIYLTYGIMKRSGMIGKSHICFKYLSEVMKKGSVSKEAFLLELIRRP